MVRVHLSPPATQSAERMGQTCAGLQRAMHLENRIKKKTKDKQDRIRLKEKSCNRTVHNLKRRVAKRKQVLGDDLTGVWLLDGKKNKREPKNEGQVTKSAGRMPWHREPMKDAISCDKLWGGANSLRSADVRMGKPNWGKCSVDRT